VVYRRLYEEGTPLAA